MKLLIIFIGLVTGMMVSAGVFALITMVGVVTRMAARTRTAKYICVYEDMVALGGGLGSFISIFEIGLKGGIVLAIIYGVFAGIFVGCTSMALAEALNAFPIFIRRARLKIGLTTLVVAFAAGKLIGSLQQLLR